MSWFTDFRDAALTGAGLKNGGQAAKVLGTAARPTFQNATAPEPQATGSSLPAFQQGGGGFSLAQTLRDYKWIGLAIMSGGGFMLFKAIKK